MTTAAAVYKVYEVTNRIADKNLYNNGVVLSPINQLSLKVPQIALKRLLPNIFMYSARLRRAIFRSTSEVRVLCTKLYYPIDSAFSVILLAVTHHPSSLFAAGPPSCISAYRNCVTFDEY